MLTPPRNEINCFYMYDFNYAVGCTPLGRGCKNCHIPPLVGVYRQYAKKGLTKRTKSGRTVWSGKVWIAPIDDPVWLEPLLPAAAHPTADPGKPPLVIVNVTSDPFHEAIPEPIIKLSFATIAASRYTGLFLTRRPERATALLSAASPDEQRLWKAKSLIGISAEGQSEFDERWAALKPLAEAGWSICASLSPLLGPIEFPADYLKLSIWTVAYGEQATRKKDARPCDPDWLRSIVRQCHGATPRMPVFVRQMAGRDTIPLDLLLHEFPSLPITRRKEQGC
jgi:protein gp37